LLSADLFFQNAETVYELADKFGCHRNTISDCLKRNGIQPTTKLNLDVQTIIDLYNDGMKISDIAKRFKVSDSTIRTRLIENSVRMRGRWGYLKQNR
jgi:transposase